MASLLGSHPGSKCIILSLNRRCIDDILCTCAYGWKVVWNG